MFGKPSLSASSENTMYFSAAWLSPANAACRLWSVMGSRSSGFGSFCSKMSSGMR